MNDPEGLERRVAIGLLREARQSHRAWAKATDKWLDGRGKRRNIGGDRLFHGTWIDYYDFIIAVLEGHYD